LIAASTLKYPPQMVEREQSKMLRGLEHNLSRQNLSKDLYLQIRGLDEAGLLEEIAPLAEERIQRGLVLMEIAQAEEIEADETQVQAETGRTFGAITRQMTPKEAKKLAQSQYLYSLMNDITTDLITQKIMGYLRATAQGEPWPAAEDQPEDESGAATDIEAAKVEEAPDPEIEASLEAESIPEAVEPTPKAEVEIPQEDESEPEAEATPKTEENLSEAA